MSHNAYITKIKNIKPAENADRLNVGQCFGNPVVIGKEYNEEDLYIYFPTVLQLSVEYATLNNLIRKKDENGNNIGGYLEENRHIKAIKLRGNRSDGIIMPLSSLATFGDISSLKEGDNFSVFNGHEICCKFIPFKQHRQGGNSEGNKTRKHKVPVAPLFAEHADTEQLAYNLAAFNPGDQIEITLKIHGTSGRTGYLPKLKKYKKTLWDIILGKEGKPVYEYDYVSGTRRTVLENYKGGYYGDNSFRESHSKFFEGKLNKGETVYYEICGFTNQITPIMGDGKVPVDYQKEYGERMIFSYGCSPTGKKTLHGKDENGDYFSIIEDAPISDIYIYRMTLTTEDGFVVDYTPAFMRYRCEQMGVKTVPVFWRGYIPENPASAEDDTITAGEWIKNKAELYYNGPDPIGKTHVREGVVVRIINRPKFCAYKHKNFLFKLISGIVVENTKVEDEEILSEM